MKKLFLILKEHMHYNWKLMIAVIIFNFGFSFNSFTQDFNHPNVSCPGGLQVNSYSGNMFLQRNDLFIKARKLNLNISFSYNSSDYKINNGFGNGWIFQYSMKCEKNANNSLATIVWSDGRRDGYINPTGQPNSYRPPTGVFDSLVMYQPGKFLLTTVSKIKYFFDDSIHHHLTKLEEPNGNFLLFSYTDSLLTQVTDAGGRTIQLAYSTGLLATVTDALASPTRIISYSYDAQRNLTEVTDQAGNKRNYEYIVNGPMNVVSDKNQNKVDIVYYPNFAVHEVISCATHQSFSFHSDSVLTTTFLVEDVESGNQVTIFKFDYNGNLMQKTGNCCGYNVQFEYDNKNNIIRYTNANGSKYDYTYDANGNMLSKKDPLGNTSRYTYDPVFSNIDSYMDKNGNTTTYSYDNKGNLLNVAYPLGVNNSYTYASNGDMISTTDGNGNTTTYNYDAFGNLIAIHKPLGVNMSMVFDNRSRLLSVTDPRGNVTTMTYDVLDRLISATDAMSNTIVNTFDPNDNLLTMKDRNNNITSYTYDALDRLTMITDALNHTSQFVYDAQSNIISATDPNGNAKHFVYNKVNRLVSQTNAANETTTYDYDGRGNITSIAFPNGNTVNLTYDALNRFMQAGDNIGIYFTRNYDDVRNLVSISDANGNTTSYTYDALYRIVGITDALGKSSVYTYDNNFNKLTFNDRNNHLSTYSYDALNRSTSFTDALGNATVLAYDLAGNLTSITDANNHSTSYTYNALNRNTLQTFADATTNIFNYDANGNMISSMDNNGAQTSYSYDALNRLLNRNYPGSNDDIFSYDAGGRMLSAINNDATVNFNYDASGRIISETLNGKSTTYSYNIPGNKRTITYPGGRTIIKTLDARQRLIDISENNMDLANFSYDSADRLLTKNYSGNGTTTNYSYDANNKLIAMITNPGGLLGFEYGYDNAGNKLFEKKVHKPDHSEQYIYDNKNQITGFKSGTLIGNTINTPLHQAQYNYDPLGNRISMVEDSNTTNYTINNMNGYTNINGTSSAILQYDNNGNVINDGSKIYSYDNQNRLISLNNGAISTYKYDALGRRVKKTVGTNITEFYYSGMNEIENRDSSGNVSSTYVYGVAIDDVLFSNINNIEYFYYQNAIGSIAGIGINTGNLIERYDYSSFGKVKFYDNNYNPISSSSINNNIYFTGRSYDNEVEKYFYRARHYDLSNGRFQQRDPLRFSSGDLNMYNYVSNQPTRLIDPYGTSADCDRPDNLKNEDLLRGFIDHAGQVQAFGDGALVGIEELTPIKNLYEHLDEFRKAGVGGKLPEPGSWAGMKLAKQELNIAKYGRAQAMLKGAGVAATFLSGVADSYLFATDPSLANATDMALGLLGVGFPPFGIAVIVGELISQAINGKSLGENLQELGRANTGFDDDGNPISNCD